MERNLYVKEPVKLTMGQILNVCGFCFDGCLEWIKWCIDWFDYVLIVLWMNYVIMGSQRGLVDVLNMLSGWRIKKISTLRVEMNLDDVFELRDERFMVLDWKISKP